MCSTCLWAPWVIWEATPCPCPPVLKWLLGCARQWGLSQTACSVLKVFGGSEEAVNMKLPLACKPFPTTVQVWMPSGKHALMPAAGPSCVSAGQVGMQGLLQQTTVMPESCSKSPRCHAATCDCFAEGRQQLEVTSTTPLTPPQALQATD